LPVIQPLLIVLVIAVAAVQGPFSVFWSSKEMRSVTVDGIGLVSAVTECLDSSRQSRIKMEFRVCRKNPAWFDSCRPTRSGLNSIEFDPITESYRVESDLHDDQEEPFSTGIPSRPEAIESVLRVRSISLEYLAQGDVSVLRESGTYIQVRATLSCRGSVNRFFANASRILTFGMVNVVETTTDWSEFSLASDITKPSVEL
jgi:hypothetical protein